MATPFVLTVLQPSGSCYVLQHLLPCDSLVELYRTVSEGLGSEPHGFKLIVGTLVVPTDPGQTLDSFGINSGDVVTALWVQRPRMLWRGFKLKCRSGSRNVDCDFLIHDRQQRILFGVDSACYFVSLDRQSKGYTMNDSMDENSELLQWDFMRGTCSHQPGGTVLCQWDKHLRRHMSLPGRDDFFDSERVSDAWKEMHADTLAFELQCILLPQDVASDEWREFDDCFTGEILQQETTSLQSFTVDATHVDADCFLGIPTPESQLELYDDDEYSIEGLNLLDVQKVGAECDMEGHSIELPLPGTEKLVSLWRVGFVAHTGALVGPGKDFRKKSSMPDSSSESEWCASQPPLTSVTQSSQAVWCGRREALQNEEAPSALSCQLVPTSKALAVVLRHQAANLGIRQRWDGYARVADVLASAPLKTALDQAGVLKSEMVRTLEEIVQNSSDVQGRPRFELWPSKIKQGEELWIRAAPKGVNYHSFQARRKHPKTAGRTHRDGYVALCVQGGNGRPQNLNVSSTQHFNVASAILPQCFVPVSKALSCVLRHQAAKFGVPQRWDGFARVADVLASTPVRKALDEVDASELALDILCEVVRLSSNSEGQPRFQIWPMTAAASQERWIRATGKGSKAQ